MIVNTFLLSNPFIQAYLQSDILGKFIFLGLIFLSLCSWIVIIYKWRMIYQAQQHSALFYSAFQKHRANPLTLDSDLNIKQKKSNPFFDLYIVLKKHTVDILNKNRRFGNQTAGEMTPSYLSPSDIDFIDAHLTTATATQTKNLDKNLFILSTVVALGPFLGLLGTVWGILTTFGELQTQTGGNAMVLSGISLALATTVLGLIDAIPALIGYNYLKNSIYTFHIEMAGFATELLAAVEMQYRKVDVK